MPSAGAVELVTNQAGAALGGRVALKPGLAVALTQQDTCAIRVQVSPGGRILRRSHPKHAGSPGANLVTAWRDLGRALGMVRLCKVVVHLATQVQGYQIPAA